MTPRAARTGWRTAGRFRTNGQSGHPGEVVGGAWDGGTQIGVEMLKVGSGVEAVGGEPEERQAGTEEGDLGEH